MGIVMLETQDIDENFEKTQKKMKELEIRNSKLDQDSVDLLKQLKVSAEQLTQFIDDKENFSDKNWEQLRKKKDEIEQKLDTELKNVRNPKKTQETLKERNVDHHWLFVR